MFYNAIENENASKRDRNSNVYKISRQMNREKGIE